MGEAVRKMTRQEMIDEANKLRDELARCKVAYEAAKKKKDEMACMKMAEIADMNAELEKMRYQMCGVNAVLLDVFGITHAVARSSSDLESQCRRAISEIKTERDKAVKQIEHDQVKIADLLNEIDCKQMELPPEEPIGAAAWLINARRRREPNAIQKMIHGSEYREKYDVYSVTDLREIAEHLLAYCKNLESVEACASEGWKGC